MPNGLSNNCLLSHVECREAKKQTCVPRWFTSHPSSRSLVCDVTIFLMRVNTPFAARRQNDKTTSPYGACPKNLTVIGCCGM